MMDNFKEDVVCSRNRLLPNILYVVSWVMIVLFGLYALLLLQVIFFDFTVSGLVVLAASAGLAVFLFFFKDNLKLESEYTFTNGVLDFAKGLRSARARRCPGSGRRSKGTRASCMPSRRATTRTSTRRRT